jgi:hypothetical protein
MASDERFFRGWKIKNAKRFACVIATQGCECGKHRVYREAGADDFVFLNSPCAHRIDRDVIGDDEIIRRSAQP